MRGYINITTQQAVKRVLLSHSHCQLPYKITIHSTIWSILPPYSIIGKIEGIFAIQRYMSLRFFYLIQLCQHSLNTFRGSTTSLMYKIIGKNDTLDHLYSKVIGIFSDTLITIQRKIQIYVNALLILLEYFIVITFIEVLVIALKTLVNRIAIGSPI